MIRAEDIPKKAKDMLHRLGLSAGHIGRLAEAVEDQNLGSVTKHLGISAGQARELLALVGIVVQGPTQRTSPIDPAVERRVVVALKDSTVTSGALQERFASIGLVRIKEIAEKHGLSVLMKDRVQGRGRPALVDKKCIRCERRYPVTPEHFPKRGRHKTGPICSTCLAKSRAKAGVVSSPHGVPPPTT